MSQCRQIKLDMVRHGHRRMHILTRAFQSDLTLAGDGVGPLGCHLLSAQVRALHDIGLGWLVSGRAEDPARAKHHRLSAVTGTSFLGRIRSWGLNCLEFDGEPHYFVSIAR